MESVGETRESDCFIVPDYGRSSLADLMVPLLAMTDQIGRDHVPGWGKESSLPWMQRVGEAERVVVLVLDGLGYFQLQERIAELDGFGEMTVFRGTSVAPTTTAAALTSLTTGLTPGEHGIVGYRMRMGPGEILNSLRWTVCGAGTPGPDPSIVQPLAPFRGSCPVVVTKAVHLGTGFTKVHLRGTRIRPWKTMSGIVSQISLALSEGERFVYAYYDGVDTTAHERGIGSEYDLELRFVDMLVQRLLEALPVDTRLIITSDHGQIELVGKPIVLPKQLEAKVRYQSGEGRFRWLHVERGQRDAAREIATEAFGDVARVLVREEVCEMGLFGTKTSEVAGSRLGDLALIATKKVAFYDPSDAGSAAMIGMHGGMSAEEVIVPVCVGGPSTSFS